MTVNRGERLPQQPPNGIAKQGSNVSLNKGEVVPEYLKTHEAAQYLGISRQFLEIARHRGDGPPYIKLSKAVRYKRSELDDWMLSHRRRHTTDED